jgi:hypothetical protein
MNSCGIGSLCIMVSSEGLAGQEPQRQRKTLVPFLHHLLSWPWAQWVLIVPCWSWVTLHGVLWLGSQLSSNRIPACSLAYLQRRKVMEVILWQSGQNNISDIFASWSEKGMLPLTAYVYFYKYLKYKGLFEFLGLRWVWRFCCQKYSLWPPHLMSSYRSSSLVLRLETKLFPLRIR